jgi:uncharacterized protein YndB with AHSA1/START domain
MPGIVADASIDIAAPTERVWEALTDPAQIEQYMFGTHVETDWHLGSPITWSGVWEGKEYQDKGVVLTYDEPRELSVTHFSPLTGQEDVPENYHRVTYTLTEEGETTHLAVSQDNNASEDEAEHSRANWEQVLSGIKKLVEGA